MQKMMNNGYIETGKHKCAMSIVMIKTTRMTIGKIVVKTRRMKRTLMTVTKTATSTYDDD